MSLLLLQRGLTGALVVLFFPSPIGALKAKILRALGPVPSVVITETAKGSESLEDVKRFASGGTGHTDISLVCLGGFSAGCQRVRALRLAGANARAFLLVDGAHAANPPADWQIRYLRDLAERARKHESTLVLSHTYIVTEPQYLSTAAVARMATSWDLPMPERGGYHVRSEGKLAVYSVYSGPSDSTAHSVQANVWLPILLDGYVRPILQPGYEPGMSPMPGGLPKRVYTVDGWMDLEAEYVPRVVTRENGHAAPEALKAQAVAARTFVLRAMRDDPSMGTPDTPLPNTETFQTYASTAKPECAAAAKATTWQVATYQNGLIFANYVAGAIWSESGSPLPGTDPKNTERWVTYNQGKFADGVAPTKLVAKRKENRGCMSQNGAHWLARHGYDYLQILRSFYGADLELLDLRADVPWAIDVPRSEPPASKPGERANDGGALLLLAGAGAAWWLWNKGSI